MSDLDTLRPEVREAVAAIDKGNGVFVNGDDCEGGIAWATVRAELLRLADENNRMRGILETLDVEGHRRADRSEAELAALKSQPFHGSAQDAIDKFGEGIELSHEEMCEIVNQAVCAERELAALKARIAKAPVAECMESIPFLRSSRVPREWRGRRVAIVKLED